MYELIPPPQKKPTTTTPHPTHTYTHKQTNTTQDIFCTLEALMKKKKDWTKIDTKNRTVINYA